jgi:hypothetical protein
MEASSFEIRKETTITYYEVSTYSEPDHKLTDTHWEVLFFTSNWGDFNKAISRHVGLNCSEYRQQKDETSQAWSARLHFLSNLLQKEYGLKVELAPASFKIFNIINSKEKNKVRVPYAFKQT